MRDKQLKRKDMKSKKIGLVIEGIKFEIKSEALRTTDYWGKPIEPKVYGSGPIASSMVKTYVKAKYPSVVCSVSSKSFANGNSLDVYVSNADGSEVSREIFSDINRFANAFEYGRYNGMEETFEYYDNSGLKSEKGTEIEAGVKYVHVNNKPAFGTYGDVIRMIRGMMAGEYVWGPLSLEESIKRVKSYNVTDNNISKALPYLGLA
jgi:hypothetical protein